MKRLFCLLLGTLFLKGVVFSQNLNLIMPNSNLTCGTTVDVPIRATNFQNLVSLQGSIGWNSNQLSFVSIIDYGPTSLSLSASNFGTNNASSGILSFSWNDQNLNGISLQDSSILFKIRFTVVATSGAGVLQFLNSPTVLEAINLQLFSIPITVVNGAFNFICASPPPLSLILLPANAVCQNTIDIPVRVKNFLNLVSLQFTFSFDAQRLGFLNVSNFGPSNISLSATNFGTSLTSSGKLIFSWFDNDLSGESLPDSTVLFTLRFNVLSNPGQSNIQFIGNPTVIEAIDVANSNVPVNTVSSIITISCNQSNSLQLFIKDSTVDCGSIVELPIRVNGYQSMLSHQGTISWDPAKFTFIDVSNFGPTILSQSISNFGTTLTSSGKLTFSWNDQTLTGVSLQDSTSIFKIRMNVIGVSGVSNFQFVNSPAIIEFINSGYSQVVPQITNGAISITCGSCNATVSPNISACLNATAVFTLTGSGGIAPFTFTYTINGGSPQTITTSTGNSISLPINTSVSGSFVYAFTNVSSTGCSQPLNISRTVTVTAPPSAGTLSGTQSICVGGATTFTSTVTGGSWSSSNTGVATINATTGAIIGIAAGTATMTYTVTGTGGCADATATRQITINTTPTGALSGTQSICVGGATTFTSTVTGGSWSSSNTGVATINATTGVISGVAAGTATMTYTVTGTGGCADATATRTVAINALPIATIQPPLSNYICQGSSVLLSATGGLTYQWFLNGQLITGFNSNIYNASVAGVYTVRTTNVLGCVSLVSNSIALTLITSPVSDFTYDKYCAGVSMQFSHTSIITGSGMVTYSWSTKVISIEAPPGNNRYRTINAVIGQQVQLAARTFVNASYNWSPSIGLNNYNIFNPVFNFNQEKEYLIKIITQAGCVALDTQLVRVFDRIEIFVADAFTPNSDGKNDKIIPKLVGVQSLKFFKIFNRWGQLLYSSNIEGEGWDGLYKGVRQQTDTYAWIAEGVDILNNPIKRSGTFILIR